MATLSYIPAVYRSPGVFLVVGDKVANYPVGLRTYAQCGIDGNRYGSVTGAVFEAANNVTAVTIAVDDGLSIENIQRVLLGHTFADPINLVGNLCVHGHTAVWDGGYKPFSRWTDGAIDNLLAIPTLSEAVGYELIGANTDGSDWQLWALQGTTGRVSIAKVGTTFTFSLPQPIRTTDSPTFGGLTLTPLSGLLQGNGASEVSVFSAIDGAFLTFASGVPTQFALGIEGNLLTANASGLPSWAAPVFMEWGQAWLTDTAYRIGDVVSNNSGLFVCTYVHTSSTADEPGTGPYWEDYWDSLVVLPAINMGWSGAWAESSVYAVGAVVKNASGVFVCAALHTSSTADEPGIGPYWEDYWERIIETPILAMVWEHAWLEAASYSPGSTVSNDSHLYCCILAHVASTADEPGTGPYWEDYWELML